MLRAIATSRDDVLNLVSADIDQVATDLRSETHNLVQGLREENDDKHSLAHKEIDVAKAASANAVAMVEDLRCEIKEDQVSIAARIKCDEVDPLRVEMHAALASRDAVIVALHAATGAPRPFATVDQASQSAALAANSSVVFSAQPPDVLPFLRSSSGIHSLYLFS